MTARATHRNRHQGRAPRRRRAAILGWILAVGCLASADRAWAEDSHASIQGLSLERAPDGTAHVRFRGTDLFDRNSRDAIESGVAATVYAAWQIDRSRTLWWSETLERDQVARVVSYDNLTKRYRVAGSRPEDPQRETGSFEEAERWAGTVDVPIPVDLTLPGEKWVRARLSCDSREGMLPFGLERVLFFLPGWGFDTGWVSQPLP